MDFKNHRGEIDIKESKKTGIAATVAGYFAAFGNKDSDGDIIVPGAFLKTIEDRGPEGTNQIMHLLQHNSFSGVLAKPAVLEEKQHGLYFESPIPDTTLGVDTVKLYKAGVYNEHSIGYNVINYNNQEEEDGSVIRLLTELKLWEGSTVAWGANSLTPVVGMKSDDKKGALDIIANRLELVQKALTDNKFTEHTVNLLQIEIGVLRKSLAVINKGPEDTPPQNNNEFGARDFLKAYDLGFNINHFFKLS